MKKPGNRRLRNLNRHVFPVTGNGSPVAARIAGSIALIFRSGFHPRKRERKAMNEQKEAILLLLSQQHQLSKELVVRALGALDDPKNKGIPAATRMRIEAAIAAAMAAIVANDFRFLEASQTRAIWTPTKH